MRRGIAVIVRKALGLATLSMWTATALAQPAPPEQAAQIAAKLKELQAAVAQLSQTEVDKRLIADVEVYAKAADWTLRHDEFFLLKNKKKPSPWCEYALTALDTGLHRAKELSASQPSWTDKPGSTIHGYISRVDNSVQPYALTLPEAYSREQPKQYPLFVKLHGRSATLNEIRFIHDHDGKPAPDGQTWVQVDVYGRGNNAYRWSGETDVFEAIDDARGRMHIDDRRITLWGFSMGGAGAWHIGLHYPSKWASVGPGAGFIDFYQYLNQAEQLPPYQHAALSIYDAVDYALNAFDVPVCAYGGELDKQLAAGKRMAERAKELNVPLKLLVGPKTAHKFHPESFKEFMAFHTAQSQRGRPSYPGRSEVRFVTNTLKYNSCEWVAIEEMNEMYEPATVESSIDPFSGSLTLKTQNVAALRIARDISERIIIDGTRLPLLDAANGLLQDVYYTYCDGWWNDLSHANARMFEGNRHLHKRHNLQGPIDDAFMEPFICVRGTGKPWSEAQTDWGNWTLDRFSREFDKWLRGRVPAVDDQELTDDMIARKNLILFGDPGSNSVLAKVLPDLPIQWTKEKITVNGQSYDAATHGVSLIYPNPLNREHYVVVNSGHTFHEQDFRASNAWLFPRLGDIAVQKFEKDADGNYKQTVVWAGLFNTKWLLP